MKLVRVLVLVMLLTAILVTPAIAAPVSQGIPTEELTPIAAYLLLTTFLIPPIIAGLKRVFPEDWDDAKKDVAVFVLCLIAGFGEMYFNGSLKLTNGDAGQMINLVVINMALTVGAAFIWYKMFWNPSGIDARISGTPPE